MERLPSRESDITTVTAAVARVYELLVASRDLPIPLRPPVEKPGFTARWHTIVSNENEQIYIGFAKPSDTGDPVQPRRSNHFSLIRQLSESADRAASTEQYDFYNNRVTQPRSAPDASAFVHPELVPEVWQDMLNLLSDAQAALPPEPDEH
jgi:hypothetical protein